MISGKEGKTSPHGQLEKKKKGRPQNLRLRHKKRETTPTTVGHAQRKTDLISLPDKKNGVLND